jgi:hypothetical protein
MTFSSQIPLNDCVNKSLCSYHVLSTGVHEFSFQESSRAAINEWIDHLVHLLETSPSDDALSLIVDTRQSGTLPMGYLIGKLRDVYRKYNQSPSLRLAFLSKNSALMMFAQMLAEIAASNEEKIIQYHQSPTEDEAVAWLLAAQ